METKRKLNSIIVLILVLTAIFAAVGVSFAYFSATSGEQISTLKTNSTITEEGFVTTVSNFGELYKAAKTEYYNDGVTVSQSSDRRIVRFGNDITLANDLLVTADVHIDLGGYTLNLNGYTLTVQHAYAGAFLVYNGTVSSYASETTTASDTKVTASSNGIVVKVVETDETVTFEVDGGTAAVSGLGEDGTATATATVTSQTSGSDVTYTFVYNYDGTTYTVTTTVTTTNDTTEEGGTTITYLATEANIVAVTYCAANMVFDTPNATVVDNTTKDANNTDDTQIAVTVTDNTGKEEALSYLAYSALYTVGEGLVSSIENRPERLTYPEFADSEGNNCSISAELFVAQKTCHAGSADYPCVYVAVGNDLMLPTHYLSTDYKIEYSSGDESVFSSLGNALKTGQTTLTVKVTLKDSSSTTTAESTAEVTFNVHVVNTGDSDAAEVLLKSYLSDYYDSESGTYEFAGGIELPLKDEDLGITYSKYTLYSDYSDEKKTEVTTASEEANGVYVLIPTPECKYLVCTDNNDETIGPLEISSVYVTDDEAVAQIILNAFYGGAIVYNSTTPESNLLYGMDDITGENAAFADLAEYIETYNVKSITYELTDEVAKVYEIKQTTDSKDYLSATGTPDARLGSVRYKFEFNDGSIENEVIDLNVLYTASGDSMNAFVTYYNQYNASVSSSLSSSFTLPFSYSKITPYTAYEFTFNPTDSEETNYTIGQGTDKNGDVFDDYQVSAYAMPDALTIKLVKATTENGVTTYTTYTDSSSNKAAFTYSDESSLVTQFDSWLKGSSWTLSSLASDGAVWLVEVDPTKMIYEDIELLILYNYKFNESDSNWTAYQQDYEDSLYYTESTVTKFTLTGGVFFDEDSTENNAINNKILFVWMSNTFDGTNFSTDDELSGDDLFIERGALAQSGTLDATTDSNLSGIGVDGWHGIEFLTGLTEANLSGIAVSYDTLVNFQAVQKLTLQNCELTEESFQSVETDSATGEQTTVYLSLPSLKELDVRNNSIATFDWLTVEHFPKLEKAHITGNEQSDGYTGNTGMSNYQAFEDLTRDGVTVYNTTNANNVEIPFAESTELNDYRRLKSLVYQAILPQGVSIKAAYKEFAGLNDDFSAPETYCGLTLSYFNLEGSYQAITADSWGYGGGTDDKDATYFSLTLKTKSGKTFSVKFYVDRWQTT